ncbi:uncharacterized protein F4822DRAFT_429870 [Hypoxylon trugodes]|uniref:uncharacterized protein n=1 Tax=Hypoxylon trugodes TaxID=326681 RepID=UPI00218F46BF|nr:uncharacterized protein F4822DRAFT_429870 [Hypoxylon trugodes]KAI1387109.1 hypothetical protein F4822DRAFT_429870 [Hypoxylon trugodes]
METEIGMEGLSIINPSPSLIKGPHLLHGLVALSSNDGLPAIDYRSTVGDKTNISYSELHCASNALATRISQTLHSLAGIDTHGQIIIPILMPQSPALYIGLLGILKTGAAFCPLNADTPKDRLGFILKDVGARIVLVNSEYASRLPTDGAFEVISIDQALDPPPNTAQLSPYRVPNAEDLAYVMYTSGSTGTPKGVGISHLAASQSLLAHNRHIPVFARFLQFAAPTFDVSVFEIFFPLFRGSTLVCCNRGDMLTDLPYILREMGIDACELTPSVAGSLLKKRKNAPGLRLLLTIGEMLTEPVIQEFGSDEREQSILWGMYGPTEATIHCTLQPSFSKTSSKNNIGFPLDTVSAFIIDSHAPEFRVLPLGYVGELAVGGSQIATGYINRPEQTSTSFVHTQWGRVYRTGDKARMRSDGTIECLGRIGGGQVKLNGQRIELGEIEHAILRTPKCHSTVVVVIANVLVAFAAIDDEPEPVAGIRQAILAQCKAWLPAFMIPTDIQIMKHFPLLPSGKIDKKALIEEYKATTSPNDLRDPDVDDAFEDDLERQICEIAERILERHIVPSSRLSALGLDSLAAIEYTSKLRDFGVVIHPIDILVAPTVHQLYHIIKIRQGPTHSSSSAELPRNDDLGLDKLRELLASDDSVRPHLDDIERIEGCSPLQQALISESLNDSRLYINQTELHLPRHLAIETIRSWFFILAQRNENFRTGFAHIDHQLYQVIWKRLNEDQIEITDNANPFKCANVEKFLHRPFQLEIIPSDPRTNHHTIILTLHHSIYDGWTIDLLKEDLSLLVRNKLLVDRPQFWQVSRYLTTVSGGDLIDAKEFWAERLRGCVPTPLPNFKTTAVPEAQIQTSFKEINLDPKMLRDFALEKSIGPQVIFQTCLTWLWAAINGVDDTIIGSVSSGRTLPIAGIEKIMGPCMTTLPLRTDLSRYTTIIELLQGIHLFNRDTLKYGSLPLAEIKRAASIPLARKLFDVIFAYQESIPSRQRSDDIIHEAWHKDAVEAKILVEISPSNNCYSCQITWHSDAFSGSQVDDIFQHLDCLVSYFVKNSYETLSSTMHCFPIHSLSHYNESPKQLGILSSLSELVERTVSIYPTRPALCFASSITTSDAEMQTLTYRELNSKANQIARYLRQSGATPGEIIALSMEKSLLFYCAVLGIIKTGCAYLPILPSTPPQRTQLILRQAQPRFFLIDESSPRQTAEGNSCPIIDLERLPLSEYSDSNLEISGNANHLAYIIYTSGTTGTPKGVSITNTNILSNIETLSRIYPHQPSDRMLQACSQAFDMSVFEIFFSWGNGMSLFSATNDTLFGDLEMAVGALKITHLAITVTVASLLEPSLVSSVKFLATAGEPMTDRLLEKWADRLWQGYGPSETTNICTVRKVSRGDSSQYLGWSFENTSAFVFALNTTELVPRGCVGELCFGGDQVAAGYLEMPELTNQKFFQHREYGRLYRSGDIGRMLPDGSLIILGRVDTQVKLRGQRIELQEIQAAVLKSRLAKTCTTLLIARGSSVQQLALFYVPLDEESSRFSILRIADSIKQTIVTIEQEVRAALPDYMVPSFVFPISTLPLTPSGKVDLDLLRHSIGDMSDEDLSCYGSTHELYEDSLEWTETESLISEAISETLRIDKKVINRWSSFVSLGLDSISAMPLSRRLQSVFQKRVPLSLILSNPSVGRLASIIANGISSVTAQAKTETSLLPEQLINAVQVRFASQGGGNVQDVLPCTPLQEAMLSSSPSSKVGSSYYNQMLFRLRLPSQIIKQHWNMMFERHGILRTCFIPTEDFQHPIVQVVLKSHLPKWEAFKTDAANFQEHVSKHESSISAAIDSVEPPVSLAIIILEDSTEYLSFVCHHAIYDGISMRHLLAEIEAAVRHEPLPTSPSFELFLREALSPPPDVDTFWKAHLGSFSPLHFQKLTPSVDSNPRTISGEIVNQSLSSITTRLRELGVSLLPLCQAAWAVTLSLLQDDSDICFGNVVSGRSIALDRIDTLVAPCFNTIPIRMNLSGVGFFQDVTKNFQQLNTKTMPYQFTSLRRVQSQVSLSRLFDTVLVLQPHANPLDENIWSLDQEHGVMDVPLVCEVTPSREQGTLTLQLHRDPSIFSYQTMKLILDIFKHNFSTCLEHPSSYVLTASRLPEPWRHHITQLSLSRESVQNGEEIALPEQHNSNESWSDSEAIVRAVLSKLVKIQETKIGRNTSIYRYGLDSIGAVQLATLLRRESYSVSAIDVFENPTCAGIAARLSARDLKETQFAYNFTNFQNIISKDLDNTPSLFGLYEEVLPCTPTQQGMISQFLSSRGAHYFNYASWVLRAEVSPRQIAEAWCSLAIRHQIFRTGFIPINHPDTSYAMVVYPRANFSVPVSVRRTSTFDDSEWRAKTASKALDTLAIPPWEVIIIDHAPKQPTMHLAIHHALYDADSLRRALNEVAAALTSTIEEGSPSIQPALSSHLDPANHGSASKQFWRGKAEELVVNKFPTMTPLRITNNETLLTRRECATSPHSLRRVATEAGVTIRAALQGAWVRVLSAYLGEMSVTFGIVLDGRSTTEEQEIMFPMVTTLPISAHNHESNADLLESMMQYNASLRRYERTPLSKIQRWLGRPEGHLFDTIIAYQPVEKAGDDGPWEVLEEIASVEYTVALEVVETVSEKLWLNLTHNSDILPTEQANFLLRQFEVIFTDLLTWPQGHTDQSLYQTTDIFSILPAKFQQLQSTAELLHQLVEQTALRTPDATALEFVEDLGNPIRRRFWTYRELDEMGNRVANVLSHHNTQPGGIIATCFNKCPEAYFSILGILKAGCAFLALDPSAPVSRLQFILEDSAAACLLIEPELADALQFNIAAPTYVITEHELVEFSPALQASLQIFPSDTCYCLYTSGTTGTPKGCLISHDNTIQAMLAFKHLFDGHWDSSSRWLQFASFHFDVSVLEQYWSWFVGITVVAAPKDLILSDITATISSLDITHIDLTPSLARLTHPDEVPSLCRGVFITGGEQLRQEILRAWGPKEVIYNAYGPTEATIGVTMFQRVPTNGRSSNIGTQFPNVGTYVFKPGTETPVLRGGVGELCVSGKLVGKGYLNRKDLSEERFPVLKQYGERVYRTGDLVRVLHDGSFDFLGRADDQVKLRGQRLEIGEINHAIKTGLSNQLTDVVTFVTRHLKQDRDLLVSFLAPIARPSLPTDLQICSGQLFSNMSRTALEACRDRLPGYMVPTYVLCVPFIPLSANNKADIKRLKSLFAELPHDHLRNLTIGSADTHRVLSEKEQLLALAISTVTQVHDTNILPTSSIFELGIDSINVARLAIILQSQGFTVASPSLILRHPSVTRLCQVLQQENTNTLNRQVLQVRQSIRAQHRHLGMVCRALEIDRREVEYIAPCTPLQEGIINRSKTDETRSAYFNQFRIDLDGEVSVSRLKDCWDNMFTKCAILRTAFLLTSDGYIQVAIKKKAIPWFVLDPGQKDIETLESERRDLWIFSNQDTLHRPVEVDYFEYHGKKILLLRLFHAVYDGHSFELLLRAVNAKYHNQPIAPHTAFVDAIAYGPLLKHGHSRPFWEDIFRGHTFQPIPALLGLPGTSDILVSRTIHVSGLEARRVALKVTHQTALQAAWLAALYQHLGFAPTIGIIFSGRSLIFDGVENVIGPMFNTLPFRVNLTGQTTWASLVKAVQEYNTSVLEFVHTPLRDIQKWCSNGQPLFDTLFAFNRDDIFSTIETRQFWTSAHSIGVPDYPLALEVVLSQDKSFAVNIAARRTIATETTTNELLNIFEQALTALVNSNDDAIAPLSSTTANGHNASSNDSPSIHSCPPHPESVSKFEVFTNSKARDIRHEVASLAGLPDEEVLESTNLFELGFDSIDYIKLTAKLKALGLQITMSSLMKNPSVKSMILSHANIHSNGVHHEDENAELDKSVTFLRDYLIQDGYDLEKVVAVLPPTPLQDFMVTDMLLSGFHRYFNHDILELSPNVDIDRLKSALVAVYTGSPILRTTFVEVDNPNSKAAFCQVVREEPLKFNPQIELLDLDDISKVIGSARDRAASANASSHLFQLTFVTTPAHRYLVLSIAHALYDGWSLNLLHEDVKAAYEDCYHLRSEYKPYLSRLLSSSSAAGGRFWADYLDDALPTILTPISMSYTSGQPVTHRSELISALGPHKLKTLCRRYRVTPQVLAQGCWAPVLASRTNSLDVIFGVVLSGRDTNEAQDLLFPTMNTVPLRIILHGTITEYFHYLQATMSDIMEFQHFPLREVQRLANFGGVKPFNTLFLLQNTKDVGIRSNATLWRSVYSSSAVEYPICIEMEITDDAVIWRIAGDEHYATQQDVNEILNDLDAVLQYVTNDHINILEFDDMVEKVSVCGLKPFRPSGKTEDTNKTASENTSRREFNPTSLELPVLEVLSEISGIDMHSIDPDHSIYHLGLDSISAIKASSMLRRRGLGISVRDLVKASSIREILDRRAKQSGHPPHVQSRPEPVLNDVEISSVLKDIRVAETEVETVLPALPVQVHMLSVWQNTNGLLFYSQFAYRISGNIDKDDISKAWSILVAEVPMLRTRFAATGSTSLPFVQIVMKPTPVNPAERNLSRSRQDTWVYKEAMNPFVSICAKGSHQEGVYLRLYIHHALYDGVSLPAILSRFFELCENASTQPQSTSNQANWYTFVSSQCIPEIRQRRAIFWTSYFRGIKPTLMQAKKKPGTHREKIGQLTRLKRNAVRSVSNLKAISSSNGTTLQAFFFAAYTKALATLQQPGKLGSQDDAVFGVYLANRTSFDGLERAPFPTLSIIPLVVKRPLNRSVIELAIDIQKDISEISSFENASVGLWEIYNWTGVQIKSTVNFLPMPEDSTSTCANSNITITEVPSEPDIPPEEEDHLWNITRPAADFALRNEIKGAYTHTIDVEAAIHGDAMDVGAFCPDTFSEAQVEGLIDDVVTALEAVGPN